MPLISQVERKSARARVIYLGMYCVLSLGSLTMIYPMLVMLSTSIASKVDYEEYRLFPTYLFDDDKLWQKYLEIRYDREFNEFKHRYRIDDPIGDFRFYFNPMDVDPADPGVQRRVADWRQFKTERLPREACDIFFSNQYRTGLVQRDYHKWLGVKFGDIESYNQAFTTPKGNTAFHEIEYTPESLRGHNWPRLNMETKHVWSEFKETLEGENLRALVFTHAFQESLLSKYGTLEKLNQALDSDFESIFDIVFTSGPPQHAGLEADWLEYTTKQYPLRYLRIPGDRLEEWKAFILSSPDYGQSAEGFSRLVMAAHKETQYHDYFAELAWTQTIPRDEFLAQVWSKFADSLAPGKKQFLSVFGEYQAFLEEKYQTAERLNAEHGLDVERFSEVRPPFREADAEYFTRNRKAIKRHFLFGNYSQVLDYIWFNGFALRNTLILVILWVGGHLLVQPMAAYALSRFRLSYANKILLFLLATMSFPHSVTMIPNFLLLKELHMLNTYWALILPNLVQGMGVFLLKGYFDSLPDELYEAGMIDGAGEMHMFWHITLPLSKPILAVIALQSFEAAYGSFMWAFLICQKEEMWTLMVFLYQFQQYAAPYTHMAALVLAAIPTLIVFLFCQRIIMRGIIIPSMK